MSQNSRRNNSKERGFIAVTYAVSAIVLLGFAGLAIDVGYMQWNKRRAQVAADAAAMGALRQLELSNTGALTTGGQAAAAMNGFTDGANNTTVTINRPPVHGAYVGNTNAVEADVTRVVPSIFMMVFGQNNVTVSAHAVARTMTTEGSIGGCIFALNQTIKSGLSINGTSMSLNSACSFIVDSSHDQAFTMGSGVAVNLSNGAHIGVYGNWAINGQASIWSVDGSGNKTAMSPNNNLVRGDPLTSVVAPTSAGLTVRVANGGVTYSKNNIPAGNSIQPGIYCGGLAFSDTNGVTFTMQPGTYIMAGGGFSANSSAIVAGTGITIYNTNSTGWGCTSSASFQPLQISGQATVNLKAPTSSTMEAMLFFQDRSITDSRDNQIVGGAGSTFDGALYFKNSPLKFAGNNSTNGYLVLVADTININGTTTLGNNYSSLASPDPLAPATRGGGLIE